MIDDVVDSAGKVWWQGTEVVVKFSKRNERWMIQKANKIVVWLTMRPHDTGVIMKVRLVQQGVPNIKQSSPSKTKIGKRERGVRAQHMYIWAKREVLL